MSITPVFTDSGKFSSRKIGKLTEKSNFSMTCNLLSQYLREKGSFSNLSRGIACNQDRKGKSDATFSRPTTTMNLLPEMEVSTNASRRLDDVSDHKPALRNVKSMDLFPQHAGFEPSILNENVKKINPESSNLRLGKTEPATAQMTIFYAGKMIVFDDFPADKAQAIMGLVNHAGTFNNNNHSSAVSTSPNNTQPDVMKSAPETISSDLPLARKASLHRFLEKRKDRISARAPYKVNGSAGDPVESAGSVSMEKWPPRSESRLPTTTSTGLSWLTNGLASHPQKPFM